MDNETWMSSKKAVVTGVDKKMIRGEFHKPPRFYR